MEHLLTHYGYAAIFLVALIEAVCIPFPSEITFGFTAALAAEHRYHFHVVPVLLSHKDLDRADRFMAERGVLSVFFGRFIPLIRAVISLIAGIGEMPFWQFLISTSASTAIYGVVLGIVGYDLGKNWHKIVKGFTYAGVLVGVVVLAVIAFGVYHRLRALRAERDAAR
jgi:membrane protein DedA with SNARE-associated domain